MVHGSQKFFGVKYLNPLMLMCAANSSVMLEEGQGRKSKANEWGAKVR